MVKSSTHILLSSVHDQILILFLQTKDDKSKEYLEQVIPGFFYTRTIQKTFQSIKGNI